MSVLGRSVEAAQLSATPHIPELVRLPSLCYVWPVAIPASPSAYSNTTHINTYHTHTHTRHSGLVKQTGPFFVYIRPQPHRSITARPFVHNSFQHDSNLPSVVVVPHTHTHKQSPRTASRQKLNLQTCLFT